MFSIQSSASAAQAIGFHEFYRDDFAPRDHYRLLWDHIRNTGQVSLEEKVHEAHLALQTEGVTFTVYRDSDEGIERVWPFDLLPRIIPAAEWAAIEAGLKQRVRALNLFLKDIYNNQRILKDGIVPVELIYQGRDFRPKLMDIEPPHDVYTHIAGIDIVRGGQGEYLVLEDNLRTPSGVSYLIENRIVERRILPEFFNKYRVRRVEHYPALLIDALRYMSPRGKEQAVVVVLTPGIYNSAYFEHTFLAREMGVELAEGRDLVVKDDVVYLKTTRGLRRVDVVYRRIDDDFLDPRVFNPDSMLGVPGLMDVYRSGQLAIANAPGTGVADDKVIYAYVPKIIRYYLDEDIIIPNVPTYVCWDEKEREYVLANLDSLVVKPAAESGGYGMLVGPHSTKKERKDFAGRIRENPRNYIAQPTLSLSRVPVLTEDGIEGRHVDLRPFILYGKEIYVLPGGLTRVALRKGSLVVNSSQGGGYKDTWVLSEGAGD